MKCASSGASNAHAHVERIGKRESDLDSANLSQLLRSVSLERRCKRGGGYRMRAKLFSAAVHFRNSSIISGEDMKRIGLFLLSAAATLMIAAVPVFAQPAAATEAGSSAGLKAIAAGVGFAIAVFGGALGQSKIGAAACEGAARNPGAAGRIQTMMILGLALIESLVLFALLIVFVKV